MADEADPELAIAMAMSMDTTVPTKPINPEEMTFPNVINSCYIDSVIMALFLFSKPLAKYLEKSYSADGGVLYLQDMIMMVLDNVRNGIPVTEDQMFGLRNLLFELGWKDEDEMFDQQDVKEFYSFLMEKLCIPTIKLRRVTYTSGAAIHDDSDHGDEETTLFIPLTIPPEEEKPDGCNTDELFDKWMNDNQSKVRRTVVEHGIPKEVDVEALHTYYLDNQPPIIGLWMNRFPDFKTRLDTKLILRKALLPFKNQKLPDAQRQLSWGISAAICHRQGYIPDDPPVDYSPLKSGHYYALLVDDKRNTYIFDDTATPAIKQVSMTDPTVTEQIKRESVFVLYAQLFDL